MRLYPLRTLIAALMMCAPAAAHAQEPPRPDTELLASAVVLASIHPTDDTYVGLPYLDRGLGGVGPGAGVGLTLRHRVFSAGIEWSAAHLEVEQRGRLASDVSTGRLRDTLLSLLAGVDVPVGASRFRLVAGVSRVGGGPTSDGIPVDETPEGLPISEGGAKYAPIAGFDLQRGWKDRVDLLGTVRYSLIDRSGGSRQRGVGSHVLRVGVGLAFRVAGSAP
jgi:hypothetical protein